MRISRMPKSKNVVRPQVSTSYLKMNKGGDPQKEFMVNGGVRRFDKTDKVAGQRTVNKSNYESPEHERFKKSMSKKLPRREVINPRNK